MGGADNPRAPVGGGGVAPPGAGAPGARPAPAPAPAGAPRPLHGDPFATRTLRALRAALGSSAARAVNDATGLAERVQQPITSGRHIVVTSIRGGSGKTTVAALLSRTFNHYRHDPVLTLEADAALGTLAGRLGAETVRWTTADLAGIVRPSMRLTDVTGYLVPLDDGGWLLPGSRGDVGARIDVPSYRTVMVALRRHFAVTVVDCESVPGEVARTALDTAHTRVLAAPATVEGVNSTRAVLDWMASLPVPLLPGTVVALACSAPHQVLDTERAARRLRETGAEVVVLPYDRHLAGGGVIRTDLLGARTRLAATRLAAEVLDRALRQRPAG
ncbi:type VII secretion protein [Streptomyces sp. 8L]|uniref:type VII secretion protein n=1 Tax=Streptomyces sp. 8L TaxID=2877242 RepID=UPI001CD21C7A|nr:type VII secretion protein [Streptomyces sp. 8L]MCA1218466.1 type VII secretion protein [Streptomyces sp. 8L]